MQRLGHNTMKSTGIMLLISFVGFASSVTHAATPFTTNGNFSVGSDGSASYSIPIQVPPGTAGMSPAISLNYNSNGGNGLLGMGWGLDGLSQISRCPQTLAQDNQIRGVMYDTSDKMCLDGQRLISTGGTYGANGTEYRTEQANFARIISYTTTPANGPDSFKVWTKAGQIIEYGNTADSRIEAAGKTVIRTWGVNKISDTKGNYIAVSYTEDNTNGEAYVQRIDYTGNSVTGLAPYASVQFIYEARPDNKSQEYVAGSVLKKTKRMTNIKTYNGTTLVKDYRVTYSNTGAYSQGDVFNTTTYEYNKNGSLITQIQECDAGSTCLTPAKFTWSIGTVLNGQVGMFAGTIASPGEPLAMGDVDGDGIKDMVYAVVTSSTIQTKTGGLYLAKGTGSGYTAIGASIMTVTKTCLGTSTGINGTTCNEYSDWSVAPYLADVNRDGKADLLFNNMVAISNGNGFVAATSWIANASAKIISAGDINGDGKADVLYLISSASTSGLNTTTTNSWYFAISTGLTYSSSVKIGGNTLSKTCTSYTNFGTTCTNYAYSTTNSSGIQGGFLGDFDGDGLADIVRDIVVYKSSGTSFSSGVSWIASGETGGATFSVGDFGGDGISDIVYMPVTYSGTSRSFNLATSNGKVFNDAGAVLGQTCISATIAGCQSWPPVPNFILGDFNYDGVGDVIVGNTIKKGVVTLPDLLVGIDQGLAATVNITQQKLSAVNGGVPLYVSDRGTSEASSYPTLDILAISPQYVVSSATVSDGNGGVLTNNYSYGGLKVDLEGRGSLGFRYQKVTQVDADINSTTFFRQLYPYTGLPSQIQKVVTSTNTLVNASVLSYANAPKTEGSAISQFPYLTQSVEQNFELSGNLINTTTKTNQYDGYGNATQINVNSGDGYSKTTTNVYYNDTSNGNWLLGRLLRSTVTSTSPGTVPAPPSGGSNVAPGVSITSPPNNATAVAPVSIQITANASDSDGTVTQVAFYANGNLLGTDTTAPYAVDVANVPAGSYTLTAVATDNNGATTTSSEVHVTVN